MSSHVDGIVAKGPGVDRNHPAAADILIMNHDDARVVCEPRRKKVAIVGFAEGTRDQAPYGDAECEIWGLNQLNRHIPRADRWFEMHSNWDEHVVEGTDHQRFLRECGMPVYMTDIHGLRNGKDELIPDFPTAVRFPLERASQFLGYQYFTSSVSYMLGLALLEGFEWIGVFGIDLIVGPEYEFQKACVEFLLGFAHGRGVEVFLPEKSALLKAQYLYGYTLGPDWPISPEAVVRRRTALEKDKAAAVAKLQTLDGAIQDCNYWEELLNLNMRGGHIRG